MRPARAKPDRPRAQTFCDIPNRSATTGTAEEHMQEEMLEVVAKPHALLGVRLLQTLRDLL